MLLARKKTHTLYAGKISQSGRKNKQHVEQLSEVVCQMEKSFNKHLTPMQEEINKRPVSHKTLNSSSRPTVTSQCSISPHNKTGCVTVCEAMPSRRVSTHSH